MQEAKEPYKEMYCELYKHTQHLFNTLNPILIDLDNTISETSGMYYKYLEQIHGSDDEDLLCHLCDEFFNTM